MTRRDFLKGAALSAAAPMIVPSRIFGRNAPSRILTMGCIGVGRQGQGDMQQLIYRGLEKGARVVAVCDVDSHRREDAQWLVDKIYSSELQKQSYKACAAYKDYRDLLERKDIDGVLIVTPDHWHAPIAVAAAHSKKDIYLEKPLTYSIAEGQQLVRAVRQNKRILQVGSQQRSSPYFLKACELTRNQRIGKLNTIRVWLPQDQGAGDPQPMPVPKNLDYDFWTGPVLKEPFTEDRVHPQRDYSRPGWLQIERTCRGMITGWGSHMNDIAQWGNGTEHTGPVEIKATAEFPDRGLFDVHTAFKAEALYENGIRLFMETGNPAGVRFEGSDGWIFVQRGAIKASDQELLRQKMGSDEIKLKRSTNHMKNFLQSMQTREDPVAPVEVGHRSNSVCVLAHIAMKLKRTLQWDPQEEQFVNDEEANQWLDYPHRKPWAL
ncbi:MAG: twin-arginine translocation signal domain-containing protein [Candidatus Aminicenantes bacterium]|nr:twin-arginine translocation signal domain-containing protein [Candidatus Aminicenantes bacterium]